MVHDLKVLDVRGLPSPATIIHLVCNNAVNVVHNARECLATKRVLQKYMVITDFYHGHLIHKAFQISTFYSQIWSHFFGQ